MIAPTQITSDTENKPRLARCFACEPVRKEKPTIAIANMVEFGELTYLFNRDEQRPSVMNAEMLSDEIEARLEQVNFDPDVDYILIGGGLIFNCCMCAVVASVYREFKVLLYDSQKYKYVESTLG